MTDKMQTTGLQKGTVDRNSDEAKGRFARGVSKGVDLAERTIDLVVSTISLDRDGEIILPSAFSADLPRFLKSSSPLLAAHVHRSDDARPTQIGWVLEMRVEAARVPGKARLGKTAAAEEWWLLASDPKGKGVAVSHGFIPVRWVYGAALDLAREFPEIKPVLTAAGMADDDRLRVYTQIELLEVSLVPVGSNLGALQVLAAKFWAADGEGEKLVQEFKTELAAEVARQLFEKGQGLDQAAINKMQAELAAKVQAVGEEMKVYVREAIDDILTLLPDTVNPPAPEVIENAPPPADGGPDAGKDEGADQVKAAAGRLLETCRQ